MDSKMKEFDILVQEFPFSFQNAAAGATSLFGDTRMASGQVIGVCIGKYAPPTGGRGGEGGISISFCRK
jgi:hypothetical protein